jgi:hypothetical protein
VERCRFSAPEAEIRSAIVALRPTPVSCWERVQMQREFEMERLEMLLMCEQRVADDEGSPVPCRRCSAAR